MAYAADRAPLDLTELTNSTIADDDNVIVGDTSDSSEKAKRITIANLILRLNSEYQSTITDSDDITEGSTNLFMLAAERAKLSALPSDADATVEANVSAAGAPIISSGAGAPSSTPGKVGDVYVDTSGEDLYIATGASSSSDWTKVDSDSLIAGNNLSDLVNAATARTNLGLGSAAVADTGTGSGNVPVLDAGGKLLESVLPALAIAEYLGNFADTTAALADGGVAASERGDWFTVNSNGGETYIATSARVSGFGLNISVPSGYSPFSSGAGNSSASFSTTSM